MSAELFDLGPRQPIPKATCTPAPIGTGPKGETCGTCYFYERVEYRSKVYLKCQKARAAWTHGGGSDIRAKWDACREWEWRPTWLLVVGGAMHGNLVQWGYGTKYAGPSSYSRHRLNYAIFIREGTVWGESLHSWIDDAIGIAQRGFAEDFPTFKATTADELGVLADYLEEQGDARCEQVRSLLVLMEKVK